MKLHNYFSWLEMYIMVNRTGLDRRLKYPNYEDERPRFTGKHLPFRLLVETMRLRCLLDRVTLSNTATMGEWGEFQTFSDFVRENKIELITTKKGRNSRKSKTRNDSAPKPGALEEARRRRSDARGTRAARRR